MAQLIYIINTSLDGYIEDKDGRFDWSEPNEEQFIFITDLIRPVGTHLLGRRMYEMMMVWETDPSLAAGSASEGEFAEVWQAADKIVYSRSLEAVSTRRTQIARAFDPDAVRALKAAAERDIAIAGPELAAQAMRAGLVDAVQVFVHPAIVGGGKPWLPQDVRLALELLEERSFGNGVVYLRYRVKEGEGVEQV